MRPSDLFGRQSDSLGGTRDLANINERLTLIQAVRLGFLVAILCLILLLQWMQPQFYNPGVWVPTYIMMAISFFANTILLFYFETLLKHWLVNAIAFGYDAVLISSLVFFTGNNQSIFLFLYLINIILCGLVYRRNGAITLALWTSILYSLLVVFGPALPGKAHYFAIAMNNFAFFAVAILSGVLSEQIDFMGGELKARGKEIGQLKDFNSIIVENVGTGMMTVDENFLISHCNRSVENILNIEKLEGKSIADIFPQIAIKMKNETLAFDRSGIARIEETFENYKGEKLAIEASVSVLRGDTKEILGYVVLFQDLTEVKRLEFQMRQQEKLAAVGQLAAGIAHEIRNPLASISGSVQMLESSFVGANDDDKRLMKIVIKEIDRLNNLITEFLEYVRPGVRKEDPIDVNMLLNELLEMVKLNDKIPQNIVVEKNMPTVDRIMGHSDKLKQAFLNIIINAYQAMEKSELKRLTISSSQSEEKIRVIIGDSGIGMDEQNLKRIFEPFHTTKVKGTGLGLAVTHKIFEDHGAKIFVESKIGEGTRFIIDFPLDS